MKAVKSKNALADKLYDFIRESFKPHFGELTSFMSNPVWQKVRGLGSRLWLDTGSIDESQQRWTKEFSALTTNNTLLNKEIQTGRYDTLIEQVARILAPYHKLTEKQVILEIAFVLNAWHGLRLVEQFDAFVSVEEHTDLADNVGMAVDYAIRLYNICPQRFIVKLPFTPAGLLATRKLSAAGIPINHTLGFSARQNYIIARLSKPAYVNVFLGRLNSFIADNKLGSGKYVGEKATLASQKVIKELRKTNQAQTLQIGASFRSGEQVRDLLGIDVMTMPPKAADEFLALNVPADQISDKTEAEYQIGLDNDVLADSFNLNTLWDVDERLINCINILESEDLDKFTPDELVEFFENHNCGDALVRWNEVQIDTSYREGKIPKLENWRQILSTKEIGFDSLMDLAGLCSFKKDQAAMDDRIRQVLNKVT